MNRRDTISWVGVVCVVYLDRLKQKPSAPRQVHANVVPR
jgi:hypothetical protein